MEQVGSAYANALVEAAQSKGALDAVHADVDALQVRIKGERRAGGARRGAERVPRRRLATSGPGAADAGAPAPARPLH
jgi:hypothetical protein